jgi:hypothetical protein
MPLKPLLNMACASIMFYSSFMRVKPAVLRPDIIVMDRDTPRFMLVAEVKAAPGSLAAPGGLEQLKRYMRATNCSVGLLVTSDRTWVLYDTFEDYTDKSLQVAGEFSTDVIFSGSREPFTEHTLALAVQGWLERLSTSYPSALPEDPGARKLIERIIVPAVVEGRVLLEPHVQGGMLAMAGEG